METKTISKIIAVVTIMALCTIYVMIVQGTDSKPYTSINYEQAEDLLQKHGGKIAVLDVRTADEYATGHLPRSINIDVKNDSFSTAISKLEKYPYLLIYCRSGRRSKQAATIAAQKLPSTKIYELDNGILGWEGKIVLDD